MKSFDAIEARMHHDLDRQFGAKFKHVKTAKRPNMQPVPDDERPPYELTCKLVWMRKDVFTNGPQRGVVSRSPRLDIMRCELRYSVDRGDQFVRCSDGARFEVTAAVSDGLSGISVECVEMGRMT